MLPVSLDYPFLVTPSVFFYIYRFERSIIPCFDWVDWLNYILSDDRFGRVMVSVLVPSDPVSQAKDISNDVCFFSAKYATLMRRSKD